MKKAIIILSIFLLFGFSGMAQVSINSDNSLPDPSSMLDVKSGNKGLLIPQVALTGTTDASTILSPATRLLIYNTAIAGTPPNNVTPGYYYWNSSAWARLSVGANGSGATNYITKWSSAGALGNSLVFDNGTSVGIGTTNPSKKLDVSGEMQATGTGANYFAGKVGIGTSSPAVTAALDISRTTRGFLPPRMTTDQRTAIISPATGLTIYNTTKNCNETYNGSSWVSNTHYIGESYGGGIVFYVYDNGQHGLIAATADQSTGIRWYGGSYTNTRARADGVGAGLKNTSIIIANQGPVDGSAFAATLCNEYSVTVGDVTYGDWYLPSKYELNLLYLQKAVVGGFANNYYWSSSEDDAVYAWYQGFANGLQEYNTKNGTIYVRAVRAF